MLSVITPATSTALTSLTRARAVLGFAPADDAAATVFIGQASRAIADHCQRPFAIETVQEIFVDNDLCGEGPMLARDPVVEILSVASNGAPLPLTECRVDRLGRLHRLEADGRSLPWWGGSLTIDYRAGYVLPSDENGAPASTLPETVERAAIMVLATYLSMCGRDPTVKSSSVEGIGETSYWQPGAGDVLVSAEAQQLLAPYRRFWP